MLYEVSPFTEPTNHDDNSEEYVVKSVLGAELKDYVGGFPLINTLIEIENGTRFHSMEIAVHFIEQKRVFKCDLGGRYTEKLLRPTLGKEKSKGTKKQGCMWQMNVNRRINSPIVTVMLFNNEHNHEILTDTIKFSTCYKNFTEEIMEQIEFYVVHGRCDAGTIRNLLQPKYPDRVFLTQDLGNAIQKIKQEKGLNNLGDAASLLMRLLELQADDPAWFVKPLIDDTSNRLIGIFWMSPEQRERWSKFYDIIIHDNTARTNKYNYPLSLFILIDNYNKSRLAAQAFIQDEKQESYEWLLRCCLEACEIPPLTFITDADPAMIAAISTVFPETHHMQCLYHLYQNLPKNLRSCLGSPLYQEFLKDFRAIQRSHCESVFERRSAGIVEKYEAGKKYITTMLLNRKHTWVKCFTSRHFTAGTQSTQRVKSENALIQKAVQSSFFLSQVQESIENRLEFELINNRYSIWKSSTLQYTQPFVIQTFFKDIDITMKKYLTQSIHDAHYKQMCQSVCYRTHQVPFSEILASDDDSFEPFFDKEVDDSIETPIEADEDRELDLKSLISMVNSDDILEIWKVSRDISSSEIIMNSCQNDQNNTQITLEFTRKYTVNDLSESYSRQISQKQLKFGTLMGEAKKAIQFAIQDDDEELIQFIREYNKRREAQLIQAESIRQQEDLARRKMIANDNRVFHNTRGVLVDSNQIMDPLKHQPKGRPATKRLKSSFEKSGSNKVKNGSEQAISGDKGRKCGLCEENGHYRNTCSKQ
ncbi:protein FAR1-RELATED SEQUENCE 5-like [Rhizophagus irregularis DAOM 181602=DAOM 197198]|nr:protein FAR1-RELATED SEQUENCE 5-like [Rhizophagus irregularis DAOM 181602=DAOM 197198]